MEYGGAPPLSGLKTTDQAQQGGSDRRHAMSYSGQSNMVLAFNRDRPQPTSLPPQRPHSASPESKEPAPSRHAEHPPP